MLVDKYGTSIGNLLDRGSVEWSWYASEWWKDIASLEDSKCINWFNLEVERKVGNGGNASFSNDIWRGELSLHA